MSLLGWVWLQAGSMADRWRGRSWACMVTLSVTLSCVATLKMMLRSFLISSTREGVQWHDDGLAVHAADLVD
jgi:hypothetical protein